MVIAGPPRRCNDRGGLPKTLRAAAVFSKTAAARMVNPTKLTAEKVRPRSLTIEVTIGPIVTHHSQ